MKGDRIEVITNRGSELKIVTGALNSDGSGLGQVLFEPPLRGTPAYLAPVIIHQPLGYWVCKSPAPEWMLSQGGYCDAVLEFEEAS